MFKQFKEPNVKLNVLFSLNCFDGHSNVIKVRHSFRYSKISSCDVCLVVNIHIKKVIKDQILGLESSLALNLSLHFEIIQILLSNNLLLYIKSRKR